jgi:hypothetical protein
MTEAEGAHGGVRFDGMAQQVARAQVRAEAALVAGGFADVVDLFPRGAVAPDQRMLGRVAR